MRLDHAEANVARQQATLDQTKPEDPLEMTASQPVCDRSASDECFGLLANAGLRRGPPRRCCAGFCAAAPSASTATWVGFGYHPQFALSAAVLASTCVRMMPSSA